MNVPDNEIYRYFYSKIFLEAVCSISLVKWLLE
jgi:hypothetical protein